MAELLKGPDEKQMEEIRKDLGEDPDRFANNMKLLEEWINCQPHLPQNYDKRILPIFIRGCKHDMEIVKKKFNYYYSIKEIIPNITNAIPKEVLPVTTMAAIVALPKLTPDGRRVTVLRLIDPDPAVFDMDACLKFVALLYEVRMHEETPVASDILLLDGSNFTAVHCTKFINLSLKKVLTAGRIAYPLRISQVHVVNAPPFAEKMLTIVKPYMHDKMKNRFLFHKDPKDLFEHIPADVLPKELNGNEESLEVLMKKWHQSMVDRTAWFEKMKEVKCTGPLPKHVYQKCGLEDSLGVGSFRKLTID